MKLWKWVATIAFIGLMFLGAERLAEFKQASRSYSYQAEFHSNMEVYFRKTTAQAPDGRTRRWAERLVDYHHRAAALYEYAASRPWQKPPQIEPEPLFDILGDRSQDTPSSASDPL